MQSPHSWDIHLEDISSLNTFLFSSEHYLPFHVKRLPYQESIPYGCILERWAIISQIMKRCYLWLVITALRNHLRRNSLSLCQSRLFLWVIWFVFVCFFPFYSYCLISILQLIVVPEPVPIRLETETHIHLLDCTNINVAQLYTTHCNFALLHCHSAKNCRMLMCHHCTLWQAVPISIYTRQYFKILAQ